MNATVCSFRRLARRVSIALSMICLAAGCSRTGPAPADVARPVKTMVVTAGDEAHVRSFSGKIEASRRAELAFQVPGLLVKLPVKKGQKIARGELIAQLRQDEFKARLETLRGQLDKARAELRALQSGERPEQQQRLEAAVRAAEARLANTRAEFSRHQRLIRTGATSRSAYDAAEAAYRVAQEDLQAAIQLREKGTIGREEDVEAKQGAIRSLEGRVVEARIQLDDSTILAPYDGVIAERSVEEGNPVRANEQIVKFQDVDEIEVAVDVPEALMVGDIRSADILKLVAEVSAAPGLLLPGRIREMAQRADPVTQTFRVRVAMQAPPNVNLLPGMTATVTLTYRRASILESRILVPIAAVYKDSSGEQSVWVIGPGDIVTRRPVKIGEPTGGRIEVLLGLQPGDRIAVAGVTFLREGMKVSDLGDALGGGQP
jgi:RND family efflux transporter MFP subunit